MIDLKRLTTEPEYRAGIERKRVPAGLIDEVIELELKRRDLDSRVQVLRAQRNAASKAIGAAAPDDREAKIAEASALKHTLDAEERSLSELDALVNDRALSIPNPAHESVPDGGEEDSIVLREVGEQTPPPPLDHADLGERFGFVETEAAVAMSGSRFASLRGGAVLLELALVQWVTSKLVSHGFTPVVPPVLVREHALVEAGFFPTDRSQVYEVDEGELFLVGTSEVPLSALHRGALLDAADLPLRYAGISPCFRREAGTHGRDTRGIFRVHQFDKVEMFSYCDPTKSWDELELILSIEEEIVSGLGLPYRVVNIAAGDLGNPAAKKFDIEVWLPSEGRYRELTSCSNYLEYSARRLGTRVRGADGAGNELLHTLNGTACAVGRTLLFLFEHYQRENGTVLDVPDVLRQYLGTDLLRAPK
ncbi:MAG: serine--tRNA ligase [Acidimicrobiia bacterium]